MHIIVDNRKVRAKFTTFAGGEEHVQLCIEDIEDVPRTCENLVAYGYLRSSQDLMRFMNMVNAALEVFTALNVTFYLPYLPYARQDRVCSPGQAFGLEMVANMLVGLHPDEIVVDDPHSGVVGEVFNKYGVKVTELTQHQLFLQYCKAPRNQSKFKNFVMVAPDKGAAGKTQVIAGTLGVCSFQADKIRDPKTGQITHTAIDCEDFKGHDVWIVDDICDGGRTFTELAKVLKTRNVGKLGLFVTHGIFSKGKGVLYNQFDYVAAAHDWTQTEIKEEF